MSLPEYLRIGMGAVLTLFGFLGTGLGILAMLDPIGTKMADDADPFGTPPTFLESLAVTAVFLVLAGLGILLIAVKRKPSNSN